MKTNNIFKKITSLLLVFMIMIPSFTQFALSAEEVEKYPYNLFGRNGITINASNLCVNGNIHTNKTAEITANNRNINGKVTTGSDINKRVKHVYSDVKIQENYFIENCDLYEEEYNRSEMNIHINNPIFSYNNINLNGNVALNSNIGTLMNINVTGEVKNANNSVVYSKYGNITIENDSTANINGLIYVPLGTLTINSPNINLNGIIIADKVVINGSSVNINNNDNIARFIGTTSEPYDFSGLEYLPEEWLGDSDADELFDIYEKVIDTDPFNPDTDGDELPDGYEVLALATDPLEVDTDLNGIWDKDEDFDSDNLNNLGEYQNGTEPFIPDTDEDGLLDGDEVHIYGTNPMKPDTDDDKLLDGEEGYNGTIYAKYGIYFDPLIPDTDNNGVLDGDEIFGQSKEQEIITHDGTIVSVSVNMNTNGNIERNLNINSKMGIDMMTSNTLGLIGEPFDFATSSSFESATIKFKIDKTKLYIPEFSNLIVMWYDEENQEFVECNSENGFEFVRNSGDSSLTVTTSHFSQYIVVDSKAWYQAWEDSSQRIRKYYIGNSSHQSTVSYNTVFAIDTSGSMTDDPQGRWVGYDPIIRTWEVGKNGAPPLPKVNSTFEGNQLRQQYLANYGFNTCRRITACESFIDVMHSNDKAAILTFANDSKVLSPLTNSKETLINALQDITDGGGTCFSEAINRSIELLGEANPASLNNIHRILLLSDGVPEPENDTEEAINAAIESAKEKNIQIYTFGLGVGSGDDKLEEIAERTNGKFYKVITPSELTRKVGEVTYQNPDLGELNDEDDDGIPDIIEICGLRPNGQPIGSDPELKDTDFDGLEDGTEVLFASAELTAYIENGKFSQGIKLKSDPLKPDSDDDGLLDGKRVFYKEKVFLPIDPNPLTKDGPKGVWLAQYEQTKLGNIATSYTSNPTGDNTLMNDLANDADSIVNAFLKCKSLLINNEDHIRKISKEMKSAAEDTTEVGADFLDFIYDDKNIAYHSRIANWQRAFGYNDMYDKIFEYGSEMDRYKIEFNYEGKEHILWSWKGDYWNLQSGAEMGLYVYNREVNNERHYDVVDFELPMTMSLYNCSDGNVENVFSWVPDEKQWWITGFNPEFTEPDPNIMVTISSADFTGYEDLYIRLKEESLEKHPNLIFDDQYHTVWILWDKEVSI